MRKILVTLGLAALFASSAASAAGHYNKHPTNVHFDNANNCTYFQLQGVTVADPTVNGGPWFAIAKSHINYDEIFAVLMTSIATGRTLDVTTPGGVSACGNASVTQIFLL